MNKGRLFVWLVLAAAVASIAVILGSGCLKPDSIFVDMIPVEDFEPVDLWHVEYVSCRGEPSAPADGSIGEWADGWFVAHSNTPNGNMIASFPAKVEVDGRIYHLAEKWIAQDLITTEEVARIRAKDGIVFQTCINEDLNWMVKYEPDRAGYGYQFARFPYTVNDDESIGFYGY